MSDLNEALSRQIAADLGVSRELVMHAKRIGINVPGAITNIRWFVGRLDCLRDGPSDKTLTAVLGTSFKRNNVYVVRDVITCVAANDNAKVA